jgi:hypothetical protein
VDFVTALTDEFARRRAVNPRYSLRAFARALGTSHSLLSRVCRHDRRPAAATVAAIGPQLGWGPTRIADATRQAQVDHLCRIAASRGFRPDARWIATRLGAPLDQVQIALQEALRTERLTMTSTSSWTREA